MQRGTIYDIAERAGVGIATVSRVLNGNARVSESTRRAVRAAVTAIGFRPNPAARQLAAGGPRRPRVAALMPFFSAAFYFTVSRALSRGLAEANVDVVLYDVETRSDKNRVLDRILAERSADAFVLCTMGIGAERREQLAHCGIPVVCIDYALPAVPSIVADNESGARAATRHMLATGSHRLAMISGTHAAASLRSREAAFRAVAGVGAPIVCVDTLSREAGRRAAARLIHSVDGLVCADDMLAVGALEQLRASGKKVPDDVQIVGFDDQPLMDHIGLSSVRQPMEELGAWGARTVHSLLARRAKRPRPTTRILPVELVHRQTTRPPVKQPKERS
jgi:DNA-binding LacI/PurR family transcriptional regulator